jgi:uncharacterized protein YjbI with pentapeptide repeats
MLFSSSLTPKWAALLALVAIVVLGSAAFAVGILPELAAPKTTLNAQGEIVPLDSVTRSQLVNELRGTWAAISGGIVIFLGVIAAFWRASATERNVQVLQEGQITERFTRAIEQLGSNKVAVRLGGIYALELIAKDSPENDHRQVMEVLTAYVRDNAKWIEPEKGWERDWDLTNPLSTAIQAILTVLARRNSKGEESNNGLDLSHTDLRRAELRGLPAQNSNLYRVRWQRANLNEANLQGAFLRSGHFDEAYFVDAFLKGADLQESTLQHAFLNGASLEQGNLLGANLEWANLFQSNLKNANLSRANLQHATLTEANLEGAYIANANLDSTFLNGANLRNIKGLTQEQIANSYWDETTVLPEGFEPPPNQQA